MLIATAMVHGVGMVDPLWVTGIDRYGWVIGTRLLRPGGLVRIRGASWILEQPVGETPPPIGVRLHPGR